MWCAWVAWCAPGGSMTFAGDRAPTGDRGVVTAGAITTPRSPVGFGYTRDTRDGRGVPCGPPGRPGDGRGMAGLCGKPAGRACRWYRLTLPAVPVAYTKRRSGE